MVANRKKKGVSQKLKYHTRIIVESCEQHYQCRFWTFILVPNTYCATQSSCCLCMLCHLWENAKNIFSNFVAPLYEALRLWRTGNAF
jgi:hypothetical protein